jgi:hypothetical protein
VAFPFRFARSIDSETIKDETAFFFLLEHGTKELLTMMRIMQSQPNHSIMHTVSFQLTSLLVVLMISISMESATAFVRPSNIHRASQNDKAFLQQQQQVQPLVATVVCSTFNDDDNSDFPPEEDKYTGSVDWDAEWKKVVKNQARAGTSTTTNQERPGKEFYKSEAEIAAIRAANQAQTKVSAFVSPVANKVLNGVPDWNTVKGDWKFWVGVLAVISVGTSLLAAAGQGVEAPPVNGGDSYYI